MQINIMRKFDDLCYKTNYRKMAQYKEPIQNIPEFKASKDIDIKFFRLLPPYLNRINIPLSGLYNDIDNIEYAEEDPKYSLVNKFSNFDLMDQTSVNMENLFSLSSVFGRVFYKEKLEGLLMFTNISDHQVLLYRLEITLTIDEKAETKTKKQIKTLNIALPSQGVVLNKREVYSVKFEKELNFASKYTIFIDLKVRSSTYDNMFYLSKQKYNTKDTGNDYRLVGDQVEISNYKKLTFEVTYPFKVMEKFHNYQMNDCFIEINIINNTIYPLTLTNLTLSPKTKPEIKIPLVDSLEEISKHQAKYLFEPEQILPSSKYLTLQSEEEINVLFKISDPFIFFNEDKYVLIFNWLNLFDANEKKFTYEFSNSLNTFNDYYKITVAQKPDKNIIKNENFKIVLKLETKNPKKKFAITLSQEALRDNDKSNDREIEIIDIIEKKIELNSKKPENNFILICKSDVLGYVYLPRLKFLLYEDKSTNPSGNVYDALLSFNCINKKSQ